MSLWELARGVGRQVDLTVTVNILDVHGTEKVDRGRDAELDEGLDSRGGEVTAFRVHKGRLFGTYNVQRRVTGKPEGATLFCPWCDRACNLLDGGLQ